MSPFYDAVLYLAEAKEMASNFQNKDSKMVLTFGKRGSLTITQEPKSIMHVVSTLGKGLDKYMPIPVFVYTLDALQAIVLQDLDGVRRLEPRDRYPESFLPEGGLP